MIASIHCAQLVQSGSRIIPPSNRPCYSLTVSGEIIEEEEKYEAQIDDEETSENLDEAKALELQGDE